MSSDEWRTSSYSNMNGNCVEARTAWRTSSHSNATNCVQAGSGWRKSSRSAYNGDCVETATRRPVVLVRDSKNPGGPVVAVSAAGWG